MAAAVFGVDFLDLGVDLGVDLGGFNGFGDGFEWI